MLKLGAWNVAAGKTYIINEMKNMDIIILGVIEVRWPGTGQINIGDHIMCY